MSHNENRKDKTRHSLPAAGMGSVVEAPEVLFVIQRRELQETLPKLSAKFRAKVRKRSARKRGEGRAEFWTCKCGREHKLRYERQNLCISRCPLCGETYGR